MELLDCSKCKTAKPREAFSPRNVGARRASSHCKACLAESQKARYRETCQPVTRTTDEKLARQCNRHNVTVEWFQLQLSIQGGKCAVCHEQPEAVLSIDHDHGCCPGQFSCGKCACGLLCRKCNTGLGLMRDDYAILASAAHYAKATRRRRESRPASEAA